MLFLRLYSKKMSIIEEKACIQRVSKAKQDLLLSSIPEIMLF